MTTQLSTTSESNLFRATDMKPIAHFEPGENNDLFEHVEDLLQRAIDEQEAIVYAFGERWGPEDGEQDQYFDFLPGNGVHLIHMNQGGRGDGNEYIPRWSSYHRFRRLRHDFRALSEVPESNLAHR